MTQTKYSATNMTYRNHLVRFRPVDAFRRGGFFAHENSPISHGFLFPRPVWSGGNSIAEVEKLAGGDASGRVQR